MKKLGFLSAFIIIFFVANATVFAYSYSEKPSMQLLVSGALGYAKNSGMDNIVKNSAKKDADDLNDAINLYNATKQPWEPVRPANFYSSDNPAKWSKGVDIDFRYFFDNLGFGLEVGYHTVKSESEAKAKSYWSDKLTSTLKLTVVPIAATLFYRIELESPNSFVLLGGGFGYYLGIMNFDWKWKSHEGTHNSYKKDYKQSKIGYHVFIEYDYVFENGFTFFFGLKGRYVKFDEFKDGNLILYEGYNKKLEAGLTGVAAYIGAGVSF